MTMNRGISFDNLAVKANAAVSVLVALSHQIILAMILNYRCDVLC